MAVPQYVVVELRVDASNAQAGAAQYSAALDKAQKAADAMTGSAQKAQAAITSQGNAMVQAKAANDNLAAGYKAANDNYQAFGKSLVSHAADFLNNVNHLKLMALGAYALSPAFRSFANSEIAAAVKLLGVNITLVESAISGIVRAIGPALSFFSRIAVPIALAVAAWKAFNYVVDQGSALLDKYSNTQRGLYSSDFEENLKKLTVLQTDTVSAAQAQYAGELANRLAEAKKTISDFLAVSIDVTDAALKLQGVWVGIVESIAAGVNFISNIVDKVSGIAQSIGNLPIWKYLDAGWNLPGSSGLIGQGPNTDNSAALAAARNRLAIAMGVKNIGTDKAPLGGSFAAHYNYDANALAGAKNEKPSDTTNAYDRRLQQIKDQIEQLNLEADGAGKTTQAYQELAVAHQLNVAAMRAGIKPTDDMRAQWKALGDQIAEETVRRNQAKVLMDETFKSQTMFMSPADLAQATAAHQIDPTNWVAHLGDAGPKLAALNSEMGELRDTSLSFLQSFNSDLVNGTVNMQTLTNAVKGLEAKLLDIAENQLINSLFKSLTGSSGSGGFSLLGFLGIGNSGAIPTVVGGAGSLAVPTLLSGGMVGVDGRMQYVHPAYFDGAPRAASGLQLSDGGIPIIAHPGERVLNPQETRAYNAGAARGAAGKIIINNYGADVQAQQRDDGTTELTIRAVTRDEMASARTNGINKVKYDQSPRLRQRRYVG